MRRVDLSDSCKNERVEVILLFLTFPVYIFLTLGDINSCI